MTAFDRSLVLEPVGEGVFKGRADPGFQGAVNMFGGWLTALMLKAVLSRSDGGGTLSSLTVNFIKSVPAGTELTLRTSKLGGSRSLVHWRCDLCIDDGAEVAVTALIVMASRRASDRHTEPQMPDAVPPETLPVFRPPGTMGEHVDVRIALGDPLRDKGSTRSLGWLRETSGRPLDVLQLVSQCDNLAPRITFVSEGRRLSPTITYSVYVHATDDELEAVGGAFILSEVVGTRIEYSTSASRSNLWSRDGVLLATSEQLQWFR